ncbi:PPOX class F420-dependent oxidoreductase [Microbispora sp. NPDC046933]|uniref:PPOX class F420-dependent oxidoreductase n=1 Tax=Microbispora sp. NPDC046933 TaxID=3155618 RepID=UPI0033ED7910
MIFTEREIEYLDGQRIGRLATIHPDGTLQVSPVGFRYNRELRTIDIGGRDMAASRKFRNVLANGKVAFVVDDVPSVDPWQVRCLEIRGRGEALTEPADSAAPLSGPIIRVHPRRIISFGIDPGNPASGKRDVPEA